MIIIANGSPVLISYFFSHRPSLAIDFGYKLKDKQPVFGHTKTWRGLITSISVTSLAGFIIGYPLITGCIIASFSMLGDLISSFIKRRLNTAPSSKAMLLDQLPESFIPAIGISYFIPLTMLNIAIIVCGFFFIELFLSKILFKFGIRKQPY